MKLECIMKRECNLVQWKCKKMVTSAMPPSHHRKAKTVKTRSISYSQSQYKLRSLINDYFITLPVHSHAEVTIVTTVRQLWCLRAKWNNQNDPWPTVACVKLCVLDNRLTTHARLAIPNAELTIRLLTGPALAGAGLNARSRRGAPLSSGL